MSDTTKGADAHVHPDLRDLVPGIRQAAAQTAGMTLAELRAAIPEVQPPAQPVWVERRAPGLGEAPGVRIYVVNSAGAGTSRPAILHMHGGGYVRGTAMMCIPQLQLLAAALDCVIVTVDYRLAPETAFPGALDDNYAGLAWLFRNAAELGVDVSRVAVMGESAGGGHAGTGWDDVPGGASGDGDFVGRGEAGFPRGGGGESGVGRGEPDGRPGGGVDDVGFGEADSMMLVAAVAGDCAWGVAGLFGGCGDSGARGCGAGLAAGAGVVGGQFGDACDGVFGGRGDAGARGCGAGLAAGAGVVGGQFGDARDGVFGGRGDAGARGWSADLSGGAGVAGGQVGGARDGVFGVNGDSGVRGRGADLSGGAGVAGGPFGRARDGVFGEPRYCGARGAGRDGVVVGLGWRADGKRIL